MEWRITLLLEKNIYRVGGFRDPAQGSQGSRESRLYATLRVKRGSLMLFLGQLAALFLAVSPNAYTARSLYVLVTGCLSLPTIRPGTQLGYPVDTGAHVGDC